MPASKKPNGKTRGQPCPYGDCAIDNGRAKLQCPSNLAIGCINDILEEISRLRSSEEQVEKFSNIIEQNLRRLYGVDVECFWALHEKSTEKEISRASAQEKKHDNPKNLVLNQALPLLNDKFHSVPFLEELVLNGIGSGHVFGIETDNEGIKFHAYSSISLKRSEKKDSYICTLKWPQGKTFSYIIENCGANACDEDVLENVLDYCSSWGDQTTHLKKHLSEIIFQPLELNMENDNFSQTENIASACAHFALMMLYAENNHYHHVSYILAPTLRGDSHSSMVIFWPFIANQGSVGPHMRFLLHMALGLNAIQESTRYETTKLVHKVLRHDMNSLLNDIKYPISLLLQDVDNPAMDREEKKRKFKSIQSFVKLSFQSIGLEYLWSGRERDVLIKETEPLSDVFKDFLKDLELDGFPVLCDGDWNSSALTPKAVRIVLANLIRNATVPVDNHEVRVVVNLDASSIIFKVMSEKAITDEWRERAFTKPYDKNVPRKHLGLWICRTIIRQLKGKWTLEQADGKYNMVISFSIPTIKAISN
jgi:hypothetical protein